jgi:hypothetical protein
MRIGEQAKWKLIRTGMVGALFGLFMASYSVFLDSEHIQFVNGVFRHQPLPFEIYAWHAIAIFLGTTIAYVLLLGILPMAIEQLIVWLKARLGGRA